MEKDKHRIVFLPTKTTATAKLFYALINEGGFGVELQKYVEHFAKTGEQIQMTEYALGTKGYMLFHALKEFVETWPAPLVNNKGLPVIINDNVVMDDKEKRIWRESVEKLDKLAPGIVEKCIDILFKSGYWRFSWSDNLIINEQLSEGWQLVSKEIKRDNNGIKLGIEYEFSQKKSFWSKFF